MQTDQILQIQRMEFVLQYHVDRIYDVRMLEKTRTKRIGKIKCREGLLLAADYHPIRYRRYTSTQAEGADQVYDVVNYRVNRGWSLLKALTTPF